MRLDDFPHTFPRLPCAMTVWHGEVDEATLLILCEQTWRGGGRLVALWGSDETPLRPRYAVHVALLTGIGLLVLTLPVAPERPAYPDLAHLFPAAGRMQRTLADLLGLHAQGSEDNRPWLRHGAWPDNFHPLRKDAASEQPFEPRPDTYPFVTVSGDGVHEIPVGPVHAGTIEPGHFRFSVVGEKVLRLEERLGYTHKGIEKRFEGRTLAEGTKLAGRISGDSTVAYAWAYAQAAESLCATVPQPRATQLRGILLELERLHNHLGDLGYLGNDVALAFGFAQFWILKEDLLRLQGELFGHRYLMDCIVPGGVAHDLTAHGAERLLAGLRALEEGVNTLHGIYDDHPGVQDRFAGSGRVAPDLAARLGLCGLAGRASGQAWDLRAQFPCAPYDTLEVNMATHRGGDVAARVTVRFEEVLESVRLIRMLLLGMPEGAIYAEPGAPRPAALGIGWVEGWRGEVLFALHTNANGTLLRAHPHDPSWQNWPLLEHAVIGNIVPDFPLINKSFNLSYSGVDL